MGNADQRKKGYRNDRGSAMVMVIVIIAFIAILVSVLMFVSFSGYQMRAADRRTKDNFYTAETVLDEINVGLQGEISEALAKAYSEVMNNFALYRSANARNKALHEIYYTELQERLQKGPSEQDYYSVAHLQGYLSAVSLGDGDGTRQGFTNGGATYGAIVESSLEYEPEQYKMIIENNSKLVLKDLKVSYVDENGYISMISTDIRISLPSFNFSQASALPDLDQCSMIADDTLFMGNTSAGGSIVVKGDVYAGQMLVGTPKDPVYSAFDKDKKADEKTPLTLPTLLSTTVSFEKADNAEPLSKAVVISRENVEVAENSTLKMTDGELWARNMGLTSATAELDGTINLKDDFTLSGQDSKAVLKGEYNGFGYLASETTGGGTGDPDTGDGETGDPADTDDTRPASSSAIVVNGRDSSLDLSGLERLTISGRAYVSTAYNAADTLATEQEKKNQTNILMGESVAVKSNQLIYLAPSEAVGCRVGADGTIGASEFGCNPLTLEQYEEILNNPDQYCLLDGARQIPSLGYKSLNQYISQSTLADGSTAYMPEVVFRQTNAGPLVYCYLRFKDEDAANQYFVDYYAVNAEWINQYTQLYAREIRMADDLLYLNLAGNMLVYQGAESGWSVKLSTESDGNSQQAQRLSALKDDVYNALSAKIMRTSNQLTDDELQKTAFSNIMDEAEIEVVLHEMGSQTYKFDTAGASTESLVLTKRDEYVIDSSTPTSVKMVVSLGNVTVKKDFEGLIIAKGNITVEAGASITIEPIDPDTFSNILSTKIDALSVTNDYYLLNIFTDGVSYVTSGNASTDMGTERVSYVDLITYENWSKK